MNATQLSKLSAITEEGGEMNVLIVALDVVFTEVRDAEVLVVAPALNSWLRHWLSDEDTARRRAEERVTAHLERLERSGVHAEGRVGDADPLLAIADSRTSSFGSARARERALRPPHVPHREAAPTCGVAWVRVNPTSALSDKLIEVAVSL